MLLIAISAPGPGRDGSMVTFRAKQPSTIPGMTIGPATIIAASATAVGAQIKVTCSP